MKPWIVVLVSLGMVAGAQGATFNVTNTNDSGAGSLRWAIEQANSTPGLDTISAGVIATPTITLASPLPAITETTLIDLNLTIDGSHAGPSDGLVILGANVGISHVRVVNFEGDGIVIRGDNATLVRIETTGNRNGIRIEARNADIRGARALSNSVNGTWITSLGTHAYIGEPSYACDFTLACPGPPHSGPSLFSGSGSAAVRIDGNENTFDSSFVGFGPDGRAMPSIGNGIVVSGANNTVYYATVKHCGGDGIVVSGPHNSVTYSNLSDNAGHGTLLLTLARFENNSGSCNAAGFIAGSLIEPPRVLWARADPTASTVAGSIQGKPNSTYRIELHDKTTTCPAPALQQLSVITVPTNADGYAEWTTTFPVYQGHFQYQPFVTIAAIASQGDAEVSGLSDSIAPVVTGEKRADLVIRTTAPAFAAANQLIEFVTIVTNSGPAVVDGFRVSIPRAPGTEYVSATTTSGYCLFTDVYSSDQQGCSIPTLALGESVTIRKLVRVSAVSGTLHYVTAVLHNDSLGLKIDPNPSNNTATADVQVTPTTRRRAAGH